MSNNKASIVVYLASAPPFLLELLYVCVLNVLLTVLIFSVRDRTKWFQRDTKTSDFNFKSLEKEKNVTIKEVIKPLMTKPIQQCIIKKPREINHYSTTTDAPNSGWSEEDSTTKATFARSLSEAIRERAIKNFYSTIKGRGNQTFAFGKASPVPSPRGTVDHSVNCKPSYKKKSFHDSGFTDYESYVRSMTTIWNKIFKKTDLPNFSSDGDQMAMGSVNVNEASYHFSDTVPSFQAQIPSSIQPDKIPRCPSFDAPLLATSNEVEWKFKNLVAKDRSVSQLDKSDSTVAIRGSDSEINFLFTDSEIKMLDLPFKESNESIYSSCAKSGMQHIELQNDYNNWSAVTKQNNIAPGSSGTNCFKTPILRDGTIKKNSFDIILEEK